MFITYHYFIFVFIGGYSFLSTFGNNWRRNLGGLPG